jgi:hypothetical protein
MLTCRHVDKAGTSSRTPINVHPTPIRQHRARLPISTEALILSALIILLAYFIRGISGFGSGLVAVPLLALYLPLQFVVPLILVVDFTASAVLSRGMRQHARWDEVRVLLPASAVGIILGVGLLINLPHQPLLTGLGLIVLLFGLRSVFALHGERRVSRWWAVPAGLTGGMIGALFGTGGPPYVIYLSHRLRHKSQLHATFSALFLIDGGLRLVTFIIAGLLLQDGIFMALLAALPLMALGLYAGLQVHISLSSAQMQRIIGGLLLVSGTSLLWKAWT